MAISVASVSSLSYSQEAAGGQRSGPNLAVVPSPDEYEDLVEVSPYLVHRAGLSERDVDVLRYLAEGWTTAAIAHELVYAESTIKKEVHLIVHRLGARNRTHAVAMAIRGRVI